MLVANHGGVVEPVHVRHRLQKGAVLGELLGRTMQQTDMGIDALDHFAVELEHQPQYAVGSRMLRPEVHRVVADLGHV